MTDPLIREKIAAEVETDRQLEQVAEECAEECDPDTLRAAASRLEAIFTDYFTHTHFNEDKHTFETFLKELRQNIDNLPE